MPSRKSIAASIVASLLFISVYAQKNIKPGYIIPLQGDTIKGYIDYRAWAKNPETFTFSKTDGGPEQTFKPFGVKEFGVANRAYRSAVVTIDDLDFQDRNIRLESGDFKHHTDTVFLQLIVDGAKSLFQIQNDKGIKSFYIGKGDQFELLQYRKYIDKKPGVVTDGSGTGVMIESKGYKGQLYRYLEDCPVLREKFKTLMYDASSLERTFENYYKCTHTETKFSRNKDKVKVEFGVTLGYTSSVVKFKGSDTYDYLTESSFSASSGIAPAFYLNLGAPGNLNKLSWLNELMFVHYSASGSHVKKTSSTVTETHEFKFGQAALRLNSQLRYEFPLGDNSGLFINGGITIGKVISSTNQDTYTFQRNSTITINNKTAFPNMTTVIPGFMGGVGYRINKIMIEARLMRTDGPSSNVALSSSLTSKCLFLSYRLH